MPIMLTNSAVTPRNARNISKQPPGPNRTALVLVVFSAAAAGGFAMAIESMIPRFFGSQ
jgi:hypothetical protein